MLHGGGKGEVGVPIYWDYKCIMLKRKKKIEINDKGYKRDTKNPSMHVADRRINVLLYRKWK